MVVRIAAIFAALLVVHLAEPSTALHAEDGWDDPWGDEYYGDDDEGGDGIATKWRKCRLKATENYWECRSEDYDSKSLAVFCYVIWDLDNIGCDIEFFKAVILPW